MPGTYRGAGLEALGVGADGGGAIGSLLLASLAVMGSPGPTTMSLVAVGSAFVLVGADWAAQIISISILLGFTTVILVLLMGLARVLFSMSRDGLLPQGVSKVHPKFRTPYITTMITGVAACTSLLRMNDKSSRPWISGMLMSVTTRS